MSLNSSELVIEVYEVKKCLIVPIQGDLYDEFMLQLATTILKRISQSKLIGVVLDISMIKIIDSINLESLIQLCQMTKLMGRETVIIGFQPSVASVLTEFSDLKLEYFRTFVNLNLALAYFHKKWKKKRCKTTKLSLEKHKL